MLLNIFNRDCALAQMLRLQLANCLDLLLSFTSADLQQEHQKNLPLLVLIQLHLSELSVLVERVVRFRNTLTAEILFYTLIGMFDRLFSHRLLYHFFEILLKLFDFDLTQISFVFCLEFLFLQKNIS